MPKQGDFAGGWLAIKSAPKGEWVLVYDANNQWDDDIEESMWIAKLRDGRWSICLDGQSCRPTHWMPLPEPPK